MTNESLEDNKRGLIIITDSLGQDKDLSVKIGAFNNIDINIIEALIIKYCKNQGELITLISNLLRSSLRPSTILFTDTQYIDIICDGDIALEDKNNCVKALVFLIQTIKFLNTPIKIGQVAFTDSRVFIIEERSSKIDCQYNRIKTTST